MVMGRRPEVETAGAVGTGVALGKVGAGLARELVVLPLARPWEGGDRPATNLLRSIMRTTVRSVMTTAMTLDTPELRSVEIVLDDAAGAVMPPPWRRLAVRARDDEVGGLPAQWIEPVGETRGTVLYLHGGGYLATTPRMYSGFAAHLALRGGCDVVIPDYRLAPEFPYPAALDDARAAYEALLLRGTAPERVIVAGDSGGGGLAAALLADLAARSLPRPAGAILISPEIDLSLSGPSMVDNAPLDILPADIPVEPYLAGTDARAGTVSPLFADLDGFPPLLVTAGGDEMFLDGIRAFVDWAALADVEVEYLEEPGMFHVFEILSPMSQATRTVSARIHEFVAALLGG